MTVHSPQITEGRATFDLAELERLADLKEALQGKIERGRWCLNLLLLDGFDREELDQLSTEVEAFKRCCQALLNKWGA